MDHRLVVWAREVKARQRRFARPARNLPAFGMPVLWLFTDALRLPSPQPAIAALPRRLCGVVFRHDGVAGRTTLAKAVARQCRRLAIPLVIAGDARLAAAVGAGVHLRAARRTADRGSMRWLRPTALVTSSAHSAVDMRRARILGVDAVFLSPVLPTRSHPGASALGVVRWAALARLARDAGMALGGVEGRMTRRLPRWCRGAGAIGALMTEDMPLLPRCHSVPQLP
jgi:thiamine-phosphate pyrophosphorylase